MSTTTAQADEFSLCVKSEYVLEGRPTCLPPLPVMGTDTVVANNNTNSKSKKRPRDRKIETAEKLCLALVRGDECPYGDSCRFTHDRKEFMANRPPDIAVPITPESIFTLAAAAPAPPVPSDLDTSQEEKEEDCGISKEDKKDLTDTGNEDKEAETTTNKQEEVCLTKPLPCPLFELNGYCPFGAMCRMGNFHINGATGENKRRTSSSTDSSPPTDVPNWLTKDLQTQLRKKLFPFKCKRNDEKRRERGGGEGHQRDLDRQQNNKSTDSVQDSALNTPYPTKKRKPVDFANKVYVAPLTTVGNLPFRRVLKRYGADITCGEMALGTSLLEGKSSEWALLKRHPEEDCFGIQVAAGYPDQFTRVCEIIVAAEQQQPDVPIPLCDFLDCNMGCPLDLVCDKGCGAKLMLRERQLMQSLAGMTNTLSAIHCPITLKMRTGWDVAKPMAHDLINKVQRWQHEHLSADSTSRVIACMVHGRSRLQRYSKLADWDYIARVSQEVETGASALSSSSSSSSFKAIPIIGNGDIMSYTDYETKVLARPDLSSCAMLARGALIKPWLPTEIKERRHWDISATERLDMLKQYVNFGLEHWGTDQQGVNNCRRFLLEWLSFLHRYVPVGLLEVVPQAMNHRPPKYMCGRSDLETLMLSPASEDWIKISEILLGPVPSGFRFEPKHKAKG